MDSSDAKQAVSYCSNMILNFGFLNFRLLTLLSASPKGQHRHRTFFLVTISPTSQGNNKLNPKTEPRPLICDHLVVHWVFSTRNARG